MTVMPVFWIMWEESCLTPSLIFKWCLFSKNYFNRCGFCKVCSEWRGMRKRNSDRDYEVDSKWALQVVKISLLKLNIFSVLLLYVCVSFFFWILLWACVEGHFLHRSYKILFKPTAELGGTARSQSLCIYTYINMCQHTSAVYALKQTSTPTQSLKYTKQTTTTKQKACSGVTPFMSITKQAGELRL